MMKHKEIFEVNLNREEIQKALIQYVRNKYWLQIPKGECKIDVSAYYSPHNNSNQGYVRFTRDLTFPMPPSETANTEPHAPSTDVGPEVPKDS